MSLFNLKVFPSFNSQLNKFIKKYPKEKENLIIIINNLNPQKASRMQGFGNVEVYKMRVPLKKYKISKSNGLRIIFIVFKNIIIPFALYQHSEFHDFKDEKKYIIEKFNKILEELD